MREQTLKKVDIGVLIVAPLLAAGISLIFRTGFILTLLLFFAMPALWFSWRTKDLVLKTLIFSGAFAIPLAFVIEYLAIMDKAWYIPNSHYRILGVVTIEVLIWAFLLTYYVIIFFEHFLDKGKHELIDKRMKYLVWPLVIVLLAFILAYLLNPALLKIKYAYFWMGFILFLIPIVLTLSFFPKLISKYVKIGSYFFLVSLIYELTALELGQWEFPGEHLIGWVELFGYRFPFEEFFFWFVLTAVAIISYYEFFDEDSKHLKSFK